MFHNHTISVMYRNNVIPARIQIYEGEVIVIPNMILPYMGTCREKGTPPPRSCGGQHTPVMRKRAQYLAQERSRDIDAELMEEGLPLPQKTAIGIRSSQRSTAWVKHTTTSRSWKEQTRSPSQWGKRKKSKKRVRRRPSGYSAFLHEQMLREIENIDLEEGYQNADENDFQEALCDYAE